MILVSKLFRIWNRIKCLFDYHFYYYDGTEIYNSSLFDRYYCMHCWKKRYLPHNRILGKDEIKGV